MPPTCGATSSPARARSTSARSSARSASAATTAPSRSRSRPSPRPERSTSSDFAQRSRGCENALGCYRYKARRERLCSRHHQREACEAPFREPRPGNRARLATHRLHGRSPLRGRPGRRVERHGPRLLAAHDLRRRDQRAGIRLHRGLQRASRRARARGRPLLPARRHVDPHRGPRRRRPASERLVAHARRPAVVFFAGDPDRRRLAHAQPLAARVLLRARPLAPEKDLHPGHRGMTAAVGRATGADTRLPDASAILPLAARENFTVASLLVGRKAREHLTAIYGFARLVDQLGDEVEGDRPAILDVFEQDLHRVFDGKPQHPLLQRLQPTVRECSLPREPFLRLIEANRRDQRQATYETFAELVDYCDLSANPVGELVLHVFGAATTERVALSDRVCTALQLAEHWQDVGEDFRRGRMYLPAEDRRRFGIEPADLGGTSAGTGLRELLAFEAARARRLLDEGAVLVRMLRGRARIAVAGYVGGGRATLDAIEHGGFDVLSSTPRASRAQKARRSLETLRRGA